MENNEEKIFASLAEGEGIRFSKKKSETDPVDEEETEEGEETDETGKKKPVTPGEETDDGNEEPGFLLKKLIADNKKAIKKAAKNLDLPDPGAGQKAYDELKALADEVNDEHRSPMIADNGSVEPLKALLAYEVKRAYDLLQSIPTSYEDKEVTAEGRQVLNDIRSDINEIINANSSGDRFALLLNVRNLYLHLMSANIMLTGEAALVNGDTLDDQSDLWLLYQLYTDEAKLIAGDITAASTSHDRDGVGDNAKEPDVTIVKPILLIQPCFALKKELRGLGIAENLVGADSDNSDFGVLGMFSIPTCFAGNGSGDLTPDEEDRKYAGLFSDRFKIGDDEKPAINAPAFTWSHNGTDLVKQQAIKAYRKANDAFVKEIKDLRKKAESHHLAEMNIDVCFAITLTGWLNAAFKVIIEANVLGVSKAVKVGQTLNQERFVGLSNTDIIFNIMSGYEVGHSNKDGSGNLFDSILAMPKYFADSFLSTELSGRFHYSQVAYDMLRKSFKSETYKFMSSEELCVGKVKLGNSAVKVTVIPKLYLPVDVSQAINNANIEIEYPRSLTDKNPIVDNPFSFAIQCRRTKWIATRNVNENQYIINVSLFHTLCQMTNAEYKSWLDYFYSNGKNYYVQGTDGDEISLATLFANTEANEGYIGYPRLLSAMAPAYKRSMLLGLQKTHVTEKSANNYLAYPLMDELYNYDASHNADTRFVNTYKVFRLSDYLKAIFNEHGDWSWVEMMIVATLIQSRYMSKVILPDTSGDNPYHFQTVNFYINQESNAMATSTAFRRALAFMDDREYGFGFTRFKGSMTDGTIVEHSDKITKQDIRNAFRYAAYSKTNYYLVDTNILKDFSAKKYWLESTGGKITKIRRLCKEDESVVISEAAFNADTKIKEAFSGALLVYDSYHDSPINITPEVIPGTKLVGWKFTSAAARNKVYENKTDSDGTHVTKVYTKLHLNDYAYVDEDFFPTEVTYTLTVPTNTAQVYACNGNEKTDINNIKLFDIAINIFHRAGLDHGNPQGFRLLLQFATGVNGRVSTRALVRNADTFASHYGTNYISGDNHADYISKTSAEEEEAESFSTTFRYASQLVVPAYARMTGMPKYINEGSATADLTYWSVSKAKHFAELVGTIIENNRSEAQTYHRGDDGSRLSFFTIRGGLDNQYGDQSWNITISLPVRDIINILEMEVK
jgi:hypothetical protein